MLASSPKAPAGVKPARNQFEQAQVMLVSRPGATRFPAGRRSSRKGSPLSTTWRLTLRILDMNFSRQTQK